MRTDRPTCQKLTVAFRNFVNAPKKKDSGKKHERPPMRIFCSQFWKGWWAGASRCPLNSASATSLSSSAKVLILTTLSTAKIVQRRWRLNKRVWSRCTAVRAGGNWCTLYFVLWDKPVYFVLWDKPLLPPTALPRGLTREWTWARWVRC
jgi:hypothetical protein